MIAGFYVGAYVFILLSQKLSSTPYHLAKIIAKVIFFSIYYKNN